MLTPNPKSADFSWFCGFAYSILFRGGPHRTPLSERPWRFLTIRRLLMLGHMLLKQLHLVAVTCLVL
jgi:hypothetical protein